jgi:hypothetical protein
MGRNRHCSRNRCIGSRNMNVRVEADSMEISFVAEIVVPIIITARVKMFDHDTPAVGLPLTSTIISINGHSISAIAPDFIIEKELAMA